MKITYTARKVTLKDNFKERVEKKLSKLEKLFTPDAAVNVVVTLENINRQTVEITIRDKAMVYRAESTMTEMNDALDKVMDILTRQIRKNKTRIEKKIKSGSIDDIIMDENNEPVAEDNYEIMRKKQILVKPISVDEAILEMNMVNHDFFMFINAETDEVNVVYKREDGNYGLLEPAAD